ncbi:putative salicylate 1-monooxygenase protein [Neofusicoccum parvum UCRNP2]|uniref:Putative salicylate 1-monooxygenase protein n=1 Tax=Botryosphaeria parva (strain UCR-NP2) TaxID=1287680 RepID=R1GMX8_BOTPV|nr:putative salicylate 1-monooxygenase protein [Neofusicoccum parvum UCRNP2]
MASMPQHEGPVTVAIVGGGITGLTLAIGLLRRNVNFTIYERARSFREIGAGIGFTPNAERAMKTLDPRIHAAFRKVATQNIEDWFNYVDGYNWDRANPDDTHEETILRLYLGERGFEGCRRPDFLEELVCLVPEEKVEFEKELVSVLEGGDNQKTVLLFRDGTSAEADVVVGCDGIRSKLRQIMLGESHPASNPSYSHKYAIRGLVPMEKARAALGEWRTSTRLMHLGPNAHALTFPVALGTLLNVVAFVTDPDDWHAPDGKLIAPATKSEAIHGFATFSPVVRTIMDLLPEQLDKWAVFDTHDYPVPTYTNKTASLRAALEVYNDVRYERSQWLVDSSRTIGEVYEWQNPHCGRDYKKIAHEIESRSHKIWHYDTDAMAGDALDQFEKKMDVHLGPAGPDVKVLHPEMSNEAELSKEAAVFAGSDEESTDVSVKTETPLKEPEKEYLDGLKLMAIIGSFTVVYFLMMLDMSILSTAIPYITDDFNSLLDVGWLAGIHDGV